MGGEVNIAVLVVESSDVVAVGEALSCVTVEVVATEVVLDCVDDPSLVL